MLIRPTARGVPQALALALIIGCSVLLAQEPARLTAAQEASSRALAPRVSKAILGKQPSLLAQQSNRSIFIETDLVIDNRGPKSLEDQITRAACQADVVIRGTVVGSTSFLTEDADFILTEYTVAIEEVLRGPSELQGKTIGYVRPGGSLLIRGRVVHATHNMYPNLGLGQYVLFMTEVEGAAGKFRPAGDYMSTLEALKVEKETTLRSVGPQGRFGLERGRESNVVRGQVAKVVCAK